MHTWVANAGVHMWEGMLDSQLNILTLEKFLSIRKYTMCGLIIVLFMIIKV